METISQPTIQPLTPNPAQALVLVSKQPLSLTDWRDHPLPAPGVHHEQPAPICSPELFCSGQEARVFLGGGPIWQSPREDQLHERLIQSYVPTSRCPMLLTAPAAVPRPEGKFIQSDAPQVPDLVT